MSKVDPFYAPHRSRSKGVKHEADRNDRAVDAGARGGAHGYRMGARPAETLGLIERRRLFNGKHWA